MSELAVGFAGASVLVRCADPRVLIQLRERLRACDLGVAGTGATCEAEQREGVWAVRRDGELVAEGLADADLPERLLYEVTVALAGGSRDRLVFHAAALARGDAGVLLAGASGSGKSTLAAWLAASGFELLSDELGAVRPDGSELRGFARPLNLKESRVVVDHPRWPGGPPPAPVSGVAARLTAIVLPRYLPGSQPVLSRLTPAGAVFGLLPCLTNRDRWPRRGLDALGALAGKVPAYGLVHPDAAAAVDLPAHALGGRT